MNLYELIQRIPDFIAMHHDYKAEVPPRFLGTFHLGLLYDMSIWQSNHHSPVFPCQWMPSASSNQPRDLLIVVSDSTQVLLILEPDHKLKNVSRLIGWFTLPALERIQRNLDNPDSISLVWRNNNDEEEEKTTHQQFRLIMQNANDCVNMIVKALKKQGATVNKNYQKKQKSERDITNDHQLNQIYMLLEKV